MLITTRKPILTLPIDGTRQEGLHVSGIIRSLALAAKVLVSSDSSEDMADRKITDRVAILRMLLGIAWERLLATLLPHITDHPGPLEVDKVHMSPDGISFHTTIGVVLHEFKLTWKSSNRPLQEEWMWLTQIKAYCFGVGTIHAVLHVYYVCGDYTYPIQPEYIEYDIVFEPTEVTANWNMLLDYARGKGALDAKPV